MKNYTTTDTSKKLLTTLLAIFLVLGVTYTQVSFSTLLQEQAVGPDGLRRCSSVEVNAIRQLNNPGLPSIQVFEEWLAPKIAEYKAEKNKGPEKNLVIQIPVVIHILHNGEPIGTAPNITDAQALSQIQVLNEDFRKVFGSRGYNENPVGADLEIEFVMAQTAPDGSATNGINRRNINQDGVTVDDLENTIKPATIWEATEYMNMWSVKFVTPDDSTLGYAQFPEGSGLAGLPTSGESSTTDGVVIRYQSFGTSDLDDGTFILDAPYDLGRTATHEVGHWIGLRHIWGDGLGCNLGAPIPGCSCSEDDFCEDTPNSDMANYGCPEDKTSPCDLPNAPTADMVENYMDYSDDPCMNIFTQDQKTRARTVMLNSPRRMELPFSPALFPPQSYVAFTTARSSVSEGSSCNVRQVAVGLEISKIPTGTVTVTVAVVGGSADGDDYELTNNTIIFSSETSTSANLLVSIQEDSNIETLESINLEIIDVSGAGVAANYRQEHTLFLADDDDPPLLAGWQPNVTLFQEGFSAGLGSWTQQSIGGANVTWVAGSPMTGLVQSVYISRTDLPGNLHSYDGMTGANVMLISPLIDASSFSNLELSFDYVCFGEQDATSGDLFDYGTVLFSTDNGQNWTLIGEPLVNEPMATDMSLALPAAANGCANLRLAFRWENDELVALDPPLNIDNVRLRGSSRAPVSVQEEVNTSNPPAYDFGPFATLNVYDPNSGRLLMILENESDFDFGCTQVTIDRSRTSAGANAVTFWNNQTSDALAAKTFQVITENIPNTFQLVTARMYFTQAEIIAWEIATGRSRTQMQIVTVADHPISAVNSTNFGDFTIALEPTLYGTFNTSNITLEAQLNTFLNVGLGAGVAGSPLPVNLVSFEARLQENTRTQLQWVTAGEVDNDYFTVEHSTNGRDFTVIGEQKGAGDIDQEKSYQFYHDQPQAGQNYYRLTQYDYSGEFTYSPIKIVARTMSEMQVKAYPNPVRSNLTITPLATVLSDFEVRILDTRGGIVQNLTLSSGTSQTIDISRLQPGIYFLNWRSAASTGTTTIVKE
ncbi:T9SS type A sorting domain-containing protein [Lewinella sp. LCG006]|uniref:T9SS type A sorting domain-containing protein n=1 Tax=Lewinella sp. LCG006 TaxID=3231911 RepID=UPI003460BBE5